MACALLVACSPMSCQGSGPGLPCMLILSGMYSWWHIASILPFLGQTLCPKVQLTVQGLHKPHNLKTSQDTAGMSPGLVILSWTPDYHHMCACRGPGDPGPWLFSVQCGAVTHSHRPSGLWAGPPNSLLALCPLGVPYLLRACLCVFKGWGQPSVGQVDRQMMCLLPVAAVGCHLSESACCRTRCGGHSRTHAWPASPLPPSPGPLGGGPARSLP